MLGADLSNARINSDQITVPRADGPDVVIPAGTYHSRIVHRDVAFINPIPWFGTSDWKTMYDWPKHLAIVNQYSINVVWNICSAADQIAANCDNIDSAMVATLNDLEGPDAAKKYTANLAAPGDSAAREPLAVATLKELNGSGMLEQFAKASDLTVEEKTVRDALVTARRILEKAPVANRALQDQLAKQRAALGTLIHGKGVLIGSVATGGGDDHVTILHERCPGVVAHGVIANAVITGRWWREVPGWFAILMILFCGLSAAYIDARLRSIWASVIILGMAAAYLLLNGLVLFGMMTLIVPIAGPMLALVGVWLFCNLARIIKVKAV